ncbi:MAG: hypothetical protein RMJ53_08145 [Chitinophagales bacterium]|nr:hypothetical protein [Chitinophagales bacterium]
MRRGFVDNVITEREKNNKYSSTDSNILEAWVLFFQKLRYDESDENSVVI